MTSGKDEGHIATGRIVWAATIVIALGLVLLLRVPTYLGVRVEEAARPSPGNLTLALDKRGSDYLWRVWWRARGEFIDVDPSWLMGVGLLAGLAVFVVGILGAYRIALSIPRDALSREV